MIYEGQGNRRAAEKRREEGEIEMLIQLLVAAVW